MTSPSNAVPETGPIVDLNTTPLIDVMLVLLVMLIITIPPQTHSLKLDIPPPSPAPPPLTHVNLLEITDGGGLLWNGLPITRDGVRTDLALTQQMRPVPELHLRPQPHTRYEAVADVLRIIEREQVHRFGFVGNEAYSALDALSG
jgi:biopolymer transport protein ExbD